MLGVAGLNDTMTQREGDRQTVGRWIPRRERLRIDRWFLESKDRKKGAAE